MAEKVLLSSKTKTLINKLKQIPSAVLDLPEAFDQEPLEHIERKELFDWLIWRMGTEMVGN